MGEFHTAAGISADSLDIQLMHRMGKLGITIAAGGIFIVDSEDAGFVAVQCQWFAMLFQIAPGGFKIGEGQFRFHKSKLHQAARRIVDVDQRDTGRRTVLEPVIVAAINQDQFAAAGPTIMWLLNFRRTLLAGAALTMSERTVSLDR